MAQSLQLFSGAMSAARSSSLPFTPNGADDIGWVVAKVFQTGSTAVTRPTSSSVIEIQGSIDGSTWVNLARLDMSSNASPIDFWQTDATAFGAGNTGAYISACAVIQLMPFMRVNLPTLANASLDVRVGEG